LYEWLYVTAVLDAGKATIYVNGQAEGSMEYTGNALSNQRPLYLGLNTEKNRPTDYVRDFDQNIPFIYGIQCMLDEVRVYDFALSADQSKKAYTTMKPADLASPLQKAVLPGENGVAEQFGASYKSLEFHELWDRMWRFPDGADVVVKFDDKPVSVVYWRGTNYAANWVTDNNRWMADQSSEIFTHHGCSEHMSDKQTRHSYARIIESNDARTIIHWRYPCVDVGYVCIDRMNYTDEFHTIYPDATAIRKVYYNNVKTEAPGFQDIQFFTNPGETALDVVPLAAQTVANIKGKTETMVWKKPNHNPQPKMDDACIQYLNMHSKFKVYAIYPEDGIGSWGNFEQSKYTHDPFAGPWNHWPVSVVPSDGRFAVATDRVTHFAVGSGDAGEAATVHYGFTNKGIETLINPARYWRTPPSLTVSSGGRSLGFNKDEKAYYTAYNKSGTMAMEIAASKDAPLVNPAIVIKGTDRSIPNVSVNGKALKPGTDLRIGFEEDTDGKTQTVVWIRTESTEVNRIILSWK
jgi:hypothetical protein